MAKNKYIETPEKLWELFEIYKTSVKQNPRFKTEYVGKDGEKVKTPLERPLTIDGFECYLSNEGIIGDLSHYFANTDKRYTDYITICSRIRKEVRNDQIEGGMVGQYNASITQRLNGLREQTDNTHKIEQEIFKGLNLDTPTNVE